MDEKINKNSMYGEFGCNKDNSIENGLTISSNFIKEVSKNETLIKGEKLTSRYGKKDIVSSIAQENDTNVTLIGPDIVSQFEYLLLLHQANSVYGINPEPKIVFPKAKFKLSLLLSKLYEDDKKLNVSSPSIPFKIDIEYTMISIDVWNKFTDLYRDITNVINMVYGDDYMEKIKEKIRKIISDKDIVTELIQTDYLEFIIKFIDTRKTDRLIGNDILKK